MTLITGIKFQEDSKERVLLASDSIATYPDGRTDLVKKIQESSSGILYAIAGDLSAKTAFIDKTSNELNKCNSLSDLYTLFNKSYKRSFRGMELSVLFVHYKSSEILVYEPPPDMVLRYEDKYVLLGSAAELVHADFSKIYRDQNWRDTLPNFEQALELCLDGYCKAISDQRGLVGLPLDFNLTNPCEYFLIDKTDEIWIETERRVKEKHTLRGIKSEPPKKKKLEFKPYEKKPEPKQVAPVQTQSFEPLS